MYVWWTVWQRAYCIRQMCTCRLGRPVNMQSKAFRRRCSRFSWVAPALSVKCDCAHLAPRQERAEHDPTVGVGHAALDDRLGVRPVVDVALSAGRLSSVCEPRHLHIRCHQRRAQPAAFVCVLSGLQPARGGECVVYSGCSAYCYHVNARFGPYSYGLYS